MARPISMRPRWVPPPARLQGERLLAAQAAQQRRVDALEAAKQKEKEDEALAKKSLEEQVEDLDNKVDRLVVDLPKIIPAGGSGKRTIAKILNRDFANIAEWGELDPADYSTSAEVDAALDGKQDASANLTSWSALAPSAKQDASANLTSWSALATSAKQDASANLTTLSGAAPGTTGLALLAATTGSAAGANIGRFRSKAHVEASTIDSSIDRLETFFHTPGSLPSSKVGGAQYRRETLTNIRMAFGNYLDKDTLLYVQMTGTAGDTGQLDESLYGRVLTRTPAVGSGSTPAVSATHTIFDLPMVYFDGTGDGYTIPDSADWAFGTGDFTLKHEGVRFENLTANRFLSGHYTNTTNIYGFYYDQALNVLRFRHEAGGTDNIDIRSTAGAVAAGTTYSEIAFVRDGDFGRIYVNGVDVTDSSYTTATASVANLTGTFRIGTITEIGSFQGWMGPVTVLARAEYLTDYTPGFQYSRHPSGAYFRSVDRYTPSGSTDATEGGYWLLDVPAAAPSMFGLTSDPTFSTDQNAGLSAAIAYCQTRKVPLLVDGYYYSDGTLEVSHPIEIRGLGAKSCGVKITSDPEAFEDGLHITASDVRVSDVELQANATTALSNGLGSFGTCVTVGDVYIEPTRYAKEARNISFDRVLFSRSIGSEELHAVVVAGRSSFVEIEDCDFVGAEPVNGRHATALLTHWGYQVSQATAEQFIIDLIQPMWEPNTYSYHPNNVRMKNCRVRNTSKLVSNSSSFAIEIDGIDMVVDEEYTSASQIVDLPAGDEGFTFCHPDYIGRDYDGFSYKNIYVKFLQGGSATARSALDATGYSVSKQGDYLDYDGGSALFVAGETVTGAGGATGTVRRVEGTATSGRLWFRNTDITGTFVDNEALTGSIAGSATANGTQVKTLELYASAPYADEHYAEVQRKNRQWEFKNVVFENVRFDYTDGDDPSNPGIAGIWLRNVQGQFTFRNVRGIFNDEGLSLSLQNAIGTFVFDNCKLDGGIDLNAVSDATFRNCEISNPLYTSGTIAVLIDGQQTAYTKNSGTTSAGATSVTFTSGITTRILRGQPLVYTGGVVYATAFAEVGDTVIQVTALPADASAGATFTHDQRCRNIRFEGCEVVGGSEGFNITSALNVSISGRIRSTGYRGLYVGSGAIVSAHDLLITDGGQRRAFVPADSALVTRNIYVDTDGVFNGRCITTDANVYVSRDLEVAAGASGGSLRDSQFLSTPITGHISVSNPQTDGGYFNLENVTDASGALLGSDVAFQYVTLVDGVTTAGVRAGFTRLYVDSGDGDLDVKFGDDVIKTITADA